MSVPYKYLAFAMLGMLLYGNVAVAEEPLLPAEFFYESAECQTAGGAFIEAQPGGKFRSACACCLHKLEHLVNLKACWKRHWRLHQPYLSTYEPDPPYCLPSKGYYTTCWRRLDEFPRCPPAGVACPPEGVWTPVAGPEVGGEVPPPPVLSAPFEERGPASDSAGKNEPPKPLTPPVPDPAAGADLPNSPPPALP